MDNLPRISLVTPNLNNAAFLERTILSVIGQNYPNLDYIIMDGGSSDHSAGIIKKYSGYFSFWTSEPDNGIYHALEKGFSRSDGDIMGWINSDDILQPKSLFTIAEIFSLSGEIQWVQGYPTVVDESDRMVYQRKPVYLPEFFLSKGYHDGRFIQQESTFWTRELWNLAGAHFNDSLKYAGDFELWMRYFQYAPLNLTSAILGSFRTRSQGQISSEHFNEYLAECDGIINKYNQAGIRLNKKPAKMATYNFITKKFVIGDIVQ